MDRQVDRVIDRQTDRQTDRQDIYYRSMMMMMMMMMMRRSTELQRFLLDPYLSLTFLPCVHVCTYVCMYVWGGVKVHEHTGPPVAQ